VTWILVILFIATGAGNERSLATAIAEFASRDACWEAASTIIDPVHREDQWRIETLTSCVPKGQPDFGQ
jgi:hypothetical protein